MGFGISSYEAFFHAGLQRAWIMWSAAMSRGNCLFKDGRRGKPIQPLSGIFVPIAVGPVLHDWGNCGPTQTVEIGIAGIVDSRLRGTFIANISSREDMFRSRCDGLARDFISINRQIYCAYVRLTIGRDHDIFRTVQLRCALRGRSPSSPAPREDWDSLLRKDSPAKVRR